MLFDHVWVDRATHASTRMLPPAPIIRVLPPAPVIRVLPLACFHSHASTRTCYLRASTRMLRPTPVHRAGSDGLNWTKTGNGHITHADDTQDSGWFDPEIGK
jgi:membrane-bound metal-dependent hydrolase YbcI (DUF457 family)